MSQVEFEEDQFASMPRHHFSSKSHGSLVKFLLKTGVVKNKKGANRVLWAVIIISVFVTLYMIFGFGDGDVKNRPIPPDPTPQEIEEMIRQGIPYP